MFSFVACFCFFVATPGDILYPIDVSVANQMVTLTCGREVMFSYDSGKEVIEKKAKEFTFPVGKAKYIATRSAKGKDIDISVSPDGSLRIFYDPEVCYLRFKLP